MSAARHAYGVPGADLVDESPKVRSAALPLLAIVIGLAAATVWFVGLPLLEPAPAKRSCEVVFLKSGTTRCIAAPTPKQLGQKS